MVKAEDDNKKGIYIFPMRHLQMIREKYICLLISM